MKIIRNNKGILLVIMFCVFIAGILLYNYLLNITFTNKAEALVRDYIEKNISGQYLADVSNIYNDVHRIESWTGNVYVRWSGKKEKMLCVESNLEVIEDEKKQIVVNDVFVLKKVQNEWKIYWHGISQ